MYARMVSVSFVALPPVSDGDVCLQVMLESQPVLCHLQWMTHYQYLVKMVLIRHGLWGNGSGF